MGNQLTGIAPSQILPVEQYLIEVPDYKYDGSLGSTRFFKVARALCKEGLSVVKVFVIHDPSLPLSNHRDRLEELNSRLHGTSNCLPFQKALQSEKAALLFRQYVKDSLYDRISTRPFLNLLEKKWIAFQILCGLNQCHKLKVFHGDIKSENVMVTGWNWVLLTDFASFKPTYLPEDNPSDFSYFFDTSRRRTCYIAPERFVESGWKNLESSTPTINFDLATNNIKEGELTPAMDIFSAGCVITELFTEGTTPFDLSQLLAYRNGEYSPWKILENIQDTSVRDLVRHMMQKDPTHRLSAEEYLIQQRGKAFPEYFYTFLKLYIQRFATQPLLPPDDRINRVKKDLDFIFKSLNVDERKLESNKGLVIVISLVTSGLRDLHLQQTALCGIVCRSVTNEISNAVTSNILDGITPYLYCSSKLVALDLLLELSKSVTPDIVLDRILPYILFFAADRFPRVRMETIKTIAQCLSRIKSVPKSDVNVFPEYIFPVLSVLTQDEVASVRATYAANIAQLAETALRFLEMTQLNEEDDDSTETNTPGTAQYQSSYDIELQALQETIQQKVVTLLSDPENSVKQTLLENGITRLCVFFGRQKANDVLLSHMITFLNDKHDWQLRGSFFDNIVGVAAYVGWQSSSILRPLLQQGMSDLEEYVVHKTIGSLTCLAELGLIQKSMLQEFVKEVAPFLAHPNIWIRHAAVGFLCAVAKSFTIADVHCNLLPQVQMFLKQKVLQLNQQVIVLNALECPIPRKVYDYILRNNHIDGIISAINARNYMRSISRYGHKPVYADLDEVMSQIFRKLVSLGMSEKHEDFILAMKDVFIKLHRSRSSSADSSLSDTDDIHKLGTLSVSQLTRLATRRHADLNKSKENKGENQPSPTSRRKKKSPQPETPTTNMNAEWKSMFGNVEPNKLQNSSNQKSKSVYKSDQSDKRGASQTSSVTSASISSQSSSTGSIVNVTQSQVTVDGFQRSISPSQEVHSTQTRYSSCKLELRNLVHHRREQYSSDIVTKEMLEGIVWDSRPPPTNWRPKGLLVAHLHEHRDAINKIDVSHDQSFFLTCSDDGSVKVWKCDLLEGKSAINRSRHTLAKQGGKIKCLTFCDGSDTFAAASDNGTINAYRIESGKVTGLSSHKVDLEEYGQVVDMLHFDSGSQQVLAYATVNGYLIGQDFRSQSLAWKLQNQPKTGLITSFAVHNSLCWLAMGTSNGSHVCWDMRFQLPITTISHPTGARVRKLLMHPREQSWIVSALQGNNEVSMWDVETGARQKVLWASSAPALSQTQASSHSVYGMNMVTTDNNMYLLTGGSDQRVRFWDLGNPNNSFVLAGAACDPHNQMVVNYSSRLIDGTEVVQEVYTKKQSSNEDIPRRGPESPAQGHHDIVSDVNICQGQQCLVITASRDGVLQVWK